jgi:hypothetical protein
MIADPKSETGQYPNDGGRQNRPHRGTIRRIGREAEKPDCKHKDLLQCILQIAFIDPQPVRFKPGKAVELKNGNAPKFRGRFDVRTVTFDVPIRPPFAPSPEVAQSRP